MKLLITLLVIVPLSVFCQHPDSVKTRKIAIGLTFSPDYNYRIYFKPSSADMTWPRQQSPLFGFTTGINLSLRLSKRFSIETGILYAQRGIQQNPTPNDNDPFWGSYTRVYRYSYIDISLKLNYYYFLGERVKLYVTGGFSPSFLLKTQLTDSYGNSWTAHYQSLIISWMAIGGVGINYNFTNRLYFTFEPTLRCAVYPVSVYTAYNNLVRYYAAGLNTGIFYKL